MRQLRLVLQGLLLLLFELFLEAHQLRDVADIGDDAKELAVLVENGVAGDEDLLLALDGLIDGDAPELLHDQDRHGLVEVALLDEFVHRAADDLFGPDPRDPLVGLVDIEHATLAVGDPDAVIGGVDDGLELAVESLDHAQFVGDLLDAGEVLEDAHGAHHLAVADDGRVVDHEGRAEPLEFLAGQGLARLHDIHQPRVGDDVQDMAADGFDRADAEQVLRQPVGHDDDPVLVDRDDAALGGVHDRRDLLAEFLDAGLKRLRIGILGDDTGEFAVLVQNEGGDDRTGDPRNFVVGRQAEIAALCEAVNRPADKGPVAERRQQPPAGDRADGSVLPIGDGGDVHVPCVHDREGRADRVIRGQERDGNDDIGYFHEKTSLCCQAIKKRLPPEAPLPPSCVRPKPPETGSAGKRCSNPPRIQPEPGILSAGMQYPRTRTLSSGYKIATTLTFRLSRLCPSQRPGRRGC